MRLRLPSRLCLGAAFAALFLVSPAFARRDPQPAPAPALKPTHPVRPAPKLQPNQEHLKQWMERHRNQSLQEQLHDLENEPGFHDLPAKTQQAFRDRLAQLNSMTPEQRNQILDRNEILESHTPEEREQFRQGIQTYNGLPPNRKQLFRTAYRSLRDMPPAQRLQIINSDRFRAQFAEPERNALIGILGVEPYPPLSGASQGP